MNSKISFKNNILAKIFNSFERMIYAKKQNCHQMKRKKRLFFFIIINIITYSVCVFNFQITSSADFVYDIKMCLQLLCWTFLILLLLSLIFYFFLFLEQFTL